ncbi:MAG: hypothetical protein GY714_18050 [Desulfobacterales bacterium]|nr:hypothetical protein [Desulfobacterales bacterium]
MSYYITKKIATLVKINKALKLQQKKDYKKIKELENYIFSLKYGPKGDRIMYSFLNEYQDALKDNANLRKSIYETKCKIDGRQGIYEREKI